MPETTDLEYFEHTPAKVGSTAFALSGTGYTGDLGFEILVPSEDATDVLDAVLDAGHDHHIRPFGEEAPSMLRIEAGLSLVDGPFGEEAPSMLRIEAGCRWSTGLRRPGHDSPRTGRGDLTVAQRRHRRRLGALGLPPPRRGPAADQGRAALPYQSMLYDEQGAEAGFTTSFFYSPCSSGTSAWLGPDPTWPPPAPRCTWS